MKRWRSAGRHAPRVRHALCGAAIFSLLTSPLLTAPAGAQARYTPDPQAIVHLDDGTLEGSTPAPGVRAFLGIRYARPPVGPLRWRPPQPFGSWTGVRPAVEHGNPCPQHDSGWNKTDAEHGKEDCLFLNVWAPATGSKHPVMVYIHGGSNVAGSAAEDLSNGLALVPRGVVLVTLDYRLGIFGFLRTPALDAESPHHASGDYGLLDQILALQWVKHNIASFGGDPARVMLFGQSAGAVDTGLLMTSPLARGLFTRALEESGQVVGLMPTATTAQSEAAWAPVAKSIGPDLDAMRAAPVEDVLKADANAPRPPFNNFWGYRGASVDGWVLPEFPARVFAQGKEAPVPLLIGYNVQEIVPGNQTPEATKRGIAATLGPAKAARLEAIYAQPGADPLLGDLAARWATDRDFRCAVRQIAIWHTAHGFPTFVYQFDRPLTGHATAEHSSELFFVFDYFPAHHESQADDAASAAIESYWTTFARTGAPQPTGLPPWPPFSAAGQAYLHFGTPAASPEVAHDPGGQACNIISGDALPGSHP